MAMLRQAGAVILESEVSARSGEVSTSVVEAEVSAKSGVFLSSLGRLLAKLPLEPFVSKMVVFAAFFRCLTPVTVMAAATMTQRYGKRKTPSFFVLLFFSKSFSSSYWSRSRSRSKEKRICCER